MKIVIENRDIDDPAETKEIEAVALDLGELAEIPPDPSLAYASLIEAAAEEGDAAAREEQKRQKVREGLAAYEAGRRALADKFKADTGYSVGDKKPWVYKDKPKVAYALWKRVIPLFLERPEVLDMGPTALVAMLAPNEPNYTIKRDMLYDGLNKFAVSDLKRLLQQHGKELKLKSPVTIRSIQKELIERRDAGREELEVERFSGRFEIRGDTAYVNGTPYKIQYGASDKPRIKRDGQWLSLDALRVFCRRAR